MKPLIIFFLALIYISFFFQTNKPYLDKIDKLTKENKELQDRVNILDFNFNLCKIVLKGK